MELDGDWDPRILYIFVLPWIVPHRMLEPEDDEMYARTCFRGFAAYPYADKRPGLLRSSCEEDAALQPWAFGVGVESGWLSGEVVPVTLSARLLLWKRAELSLRTDSLLEIGTNLRDQAFMTTGHASFRFAESKHVDFRMGLGPRAFSRKATRFGADLLYGVDIYGRKPIVTRLEFHAGSLRRTFVGQFRGTLGVMVGRAEIYGGYDHTYLSDGSDAGVRLRGPIAGARGWF